ncbi:molybdate transport system regulatory protein [Arboricoccus pini]|uniref:Molybdate transport system regulatory protein n=1 Tax=Arboricoccus pini TaxID=1963835 RepID=A0A212RZZ8_9PROT|nr:molybdate transport system regulatory protein [Arboricoccus pini]
MRVDFLGGTPERRLGPGKIALLEAIARTGSISAAGRSLGMSYKRAWDLTDAMNRLFKAPVVETRSGGRDHGGAVLTTTGQCVLETYRALEVRAMSAADTHLAALAELLATPSADG